MKTSKIYIKKILRLFILVLIGTVIYFQGKTAPADSDQQKPAEASILKYIQQLFPDAVEYQKDTASEKAAEVYDSNGKRIGFYLSSAPYTNEIKGYAGPVPLIIGLDHNYAITGVVLLPNSETPDVVKYISKKGFLNLWNTLTTKEALSHKVDTISGATVTTDAIINNVLKRLELLNHQVPSRFGGGTSLMKSGLAFLVISFGIAGFFLPRQINRFRIVLILANICVLGFFSTYLISLALIHGWIQNGIPWQTMPVFAILVILSFLFPLITNRRLYCVYICPYGGAQELAGKILRKKTELPQFIRKSRKVLRVGLLAVIVILAATGSTGNLTLFEPFAAFMFRSASSYILIFAVVFLVVSLFYPRFWCSYLCPTGQLLDSVLVQPEKDTLETH